MNQLKVACFMQCTSCSSCNAHHDQIIGSRLRRVPPHRHSSLQSTASMTAPGMRASIYQLKPCQSPSCVGSIVWTTVPLAAEKAMRRVCGKRGKPSPRKSWCCGSWCQCNCHLLRGVHEAMCNAFTFMYLQNALTIHESSVTDKCHETVAAYRSWERSCVQHVCTLKLAHRTIKSNHPSISSICYVYAWYLVQINTQLFSALTARWGATPLAKPQLAWPSVSAEEKATGSL